MASDEPQGTGDAARRAPTDDDAAPAVPREDAGPRPGEHPSVRRSGGRTSTAIALAVVLLLALAMYAAIATDIFASNA